jgi:hypothetical protein
MKLFPVSRWLCAVAIFAAFPSTTPDEGMWPFDGLPLQYLKEKHNFEPSQQWLEHVRLGSVRFDTGGSGSFVSPNGLVMTNHHVALTTIQAVSTKEKDWVEPGFSSKLYGSEVKGKGLTLRQLTEIKNVTKEIVALPEAEREEKLKEMCAGITDPKTHIEADPVVLYDGNEFRIHVYHKYDDVRLVFAPEKQVAFYGGDYDNFTYPRYCLDCAFFRVYEDGKPIDSSKFYFPWNSDGAKKDELVFVSGHPGNTERLLTHAEMEFHRDIQTPRIVERLTTMLAQTKEQMDSDPDKAFALRDQFFGIANSLKAYQGHLAGLRDATMMEKMKARDEELVAKSGKPEVKAAFDAISQGYAEFRADSNPCWSELKVPTTFGCDPCSPVVTECIPQRGGNRYKRYKFNTPDPSECNDLAGIPSVEGSEFQIRVTLTGAATVDRVRLMANIKNNDDSPVGDCPEENQECEPFSCCQEKYWQYNIVN